LIEHKSYPDNLTLFQLGSYLCQAYINQSKQGQEFHIIIPLIYYNGGIKCKVKNMDELFREIPASLTKYLPKFSYEFLDLAQLSENEILNLQNGMLASSMLIEKYRLSPEDIFNKFNMIINTLAPYHKGNFLFKFIVYLYNVTEFSNFEFEKLITENNIIPQELKNEIMSTADFLIEKGKVEGKVEGKAEQNEKIVCNAYIKIKDIAFVADITSLTHEEVIEILKKNELL
jgi:predicted transposase/invertase (TIGR01784 family)